MKVATTVVLLLLLLVAKRDSRAARAARQAAVRRRECTAAHGAGTVGGNFFNFVRHTQSVTQSGSITLNVDSKLLDF